MRNREYHKLRNTAVADEKAMEVFKNAEELIYEDARSIKEPR